MMDEKIKQASLLKYPLMENGRYSELNSFCRSAFIWGAEMALNEMFGWIDPSMELPEIHLYKESKKVLLRVFSSNSKKDDYIIGQYSYQHGHWFNDRGVSVNPTGWRPINLEDMP